MQCAPAHAMDGGWSMKRMLWVESLCDNSQGVCPGDDGSGTSAICACVVWHHKSLAPRT